MPKILYRALSPSGVLEPGFVDAASETEAVAQLKGRGFTQIELLESAVMATGHGERAGMDAAHAAALAAFLVKVREKPGLSMVLREVLRQQKIALIAYVLVGLAGVWQHMPLLTLLCAFGVVATFAKPVWKHRYSRHFQRLLKARAEGDWDEAARMIARFRKSKQPEKILRTIEVYAAQVDVRKGGALAQAVQKVEALRPGFAAQPGLLDSHIASLHAAAKDYPGVLDWVRKGYAIAPQDPTKQVDLALVEARFGDLARARELLAALDAEAVQVQGRPFVAWTRGLVALREGDPAAAQGHLLAAVSDMLKSPSPASLPALALASGACAVAMMRTGEPDNARKMLAQVAPLLAVHGDDVLMRMIEKEIGAG